MVNLLHYGIGALEYDIFLRFWGITQWVFGHFLLLCLIEQLVFGPISSMPVAIIDYLERPLLAKSRGVIIHPQLTCRLHVELRPVTVAAYLGTVFRACLQILCVISGLSAWFGLDCFLL
jgi:hypothetical protein